VDLSTASQTIPNDIARLLNARQRRFLDWRIHKKPWPEKSLITPIMVARDSWSQALASGLQLMQRWQISGATGSFGSAGRSAI